MRDMYSNMMWGSGICSICSMFFFSHIYTVCQVYVHLTQCIVLIADKCPILSVVISPDHSAIENATCQ